MQMRFGIEFLPVISTLDIAYNARIAEEQGFSNVWITDHYSNRNIYVTLTHVALWTNRITIGAGVVNPYHISPAVIASSIATIDEISSGRTVLGIGAGDKITLMDLGIERKNNLAAVRESVEVIRQLWTGKTVKHEGIAFNMPNAKLGFKISNILPIYLAAQGPKMTELAAEIAEGVLINASHPRDFVFAEKMLKKGSMKSQRCITPPNFDVGAYTVFSTDKDREKAVKAARIPVAYVVAGCLQEVLDRHEIDKAVSDKIAENLQKGNISEAKALVNDKMMDAFAVIGDTDEIIDKVEALKRAGVSQVVVGSPIGPDITKAIKTIGKNVIPAFKQEE
jgi:5,10-methylenetetrahydromethanopterin reductase